MMNIHLLVPLRCKSAFFLLMFFLSISFLSIAQTNFPFSSSNLNGVNLTNPTSLQYGPDGKLYVSQQNGIIKVYTVVRNTVNNYSISSTETINLINQIPNHNDDGSLATTVTTRQVTGILVKGTASNPILYVTSSDSRIGGPGGDTNLDTNSGIISRLTWDGTKWSKIDLIRGLPRSEENHSVNGLQIDEQTNFLYVAVSGFTNGGAPSNNFGYITEYALSASILSIDLNVINALPTQGFGNNAFKYDLPTVDDPTRSNNNGKDINDPFGGNDGLNQAKIVLGGPVQVYASGLRTPYDLVITKSRHLYVTDNGGNQGWGGYPDNEGSHGSVTNNYIEGEPGSTGPGINDPQINNLDQFSHIGHLDSYVPGTFYGGHPNPIRANPTGAGLFTHNGTNKIFRTSKFGPNPLPIDWPPVPEELANPIEGDFQLMGYTDNSLLTFDNSTNGITEYTASNFNGALKGVLLATNFNGPVVKIQLTPEGNGVLNAKNSTDRMNNEADFFSGFGTLPLDIVAQGDDEIFPGTVWVISYETGNITVFEPQDNVICSGIYSNNIDDDGDGYSNADEVDNNTLPCSPSSKPNDFDLDHLSDLNDPDDDNDNIFDNIDLFAIDSNNGTLKSLPVDYELFNGSPGTGFFGLGFTGLMSNRLTNNDYLNLFSNTNLTAGGAVGAFSVVKVTEGDALGQINNQQYAFQFGINVNSSTGPFTVRSKMLGPFFNNTTPSGFQSQGIFVGTGDQDNYFKITMNANEGGGGIEIVYENAGVPVIIQHALPGGIPSSSIDLFLTINPLTGTIQPKYSKDNGSIIVLGSPISIAGNLLTAIKSSPALAVGIISTSRGASPFTATWDFIKVTNDPITVPGQWNILSSNSGSAIGREENAYVQAGNKFYLIGGRGILPVQEYDPNTKTWTNKANTPIELHHFQAISLNGLIYIVGAMTGAFPRETPVSNVYIYNPVNDSWIIGASIPTARKRGSAGVVTFNNKIYLVSGITDGHWSGNVNWFDEYDPSTNSWTIFPDAPRARDHFHAVINNNKLYLAGGRRSSASTNETFNLLVPEVDVYDFSNNQWITLPFSSNLPVPRAGASTVTLGNEVVVIGGESTQTNAHIETHALNTTLNVWRQLDDLEQSRHGSQAIENNNGLYIVAGAGLQGGTPLLNSQEVFHMFGPTPPIGTAVLPSSLTCSTNVDFGQVAVGTINSQTLTVTNTGINQGIVISDLNIIGSTSFTITTPYSFPITLASGESINLTISFTPTIENAENATLNILNSGQTENITITLEGVSSNLTPLYKINAGGNALSTSIGDFTPDEYFSSSNTFSGSSPIAGTFDDALYQSERWGDGTLNYNIPATNGQYKVVLHFAELVFNAINQRVFDVSVEGTKVLDNFDIVKKVGGLTATTEIVNTTVDDGLLNINLSSLALDGGINNPKISAIEVYRLTGNSGAPVLSIPIPDQTGTIGTPFSFSFPMGTFTDPNGDLLYYTSRLANGEILPPWLVFDSSTRTFSGTPTNQGPTSFVIKVEATDGNGGVVSDEFFLNIENNSQTIVFKINSGGSAVTNSLGSFEADKYFKGSSSIFTNSVSISGTDDDLIYQSERWGDGLFSYEFPVSDGLYKIVLHFAELFFNSNGQRVFDVGIENLKVLDNFDIVKKVGSFTATTESFTTNVSDGLLNITFSSLASDGGVNNPKVSAIEIFRINNASETPVANAGSDQDIAFPANTVSLAGSGSDSNGTITNYLWSQISGPNLVTFSSTTIPNPIVSNLIKGTYVLGLIVTDNEGLSSIIDQINITVNPAINKAPVANAGVDQIITLPVNSVVLSGSGTDSDGMISSFQWNQISGPNSAILSNVNIANPEVSGLIQGTYVFTLVVRDNNMLVSQSDEVNIIVNSSAGNSEVVYRINAGGGAIMNSIGSFASDQYFSASSSTFSTSNQIAGTNDDAIYQTERWGDGVLNYTFPLSNGSYKIVLHFAELFFTSQGQRVFDISIEGIKVLDNFDIVKKVGSFTATTETFNTIVSDNQLSIDLNSLIANGGINNPKISAIEIIKVNQNSGDPVVAISIPDQNATTGSEFVFTLPLGTFSDPDNDTLFYTSTLSNSNQLPSWLNFISGTRKFIGTPPESASLSIRVRASDNKGGSAFDEFNLIIKSNISNPSVYKFNSGGPETITSTGNFLPDQYFSGTTSVFANTIQITGTNDDIIYQSERWGEGSMGYNLPVSNGKYMVILHFAELFFTNSGQRVFDVSFENSKVLDNFDIVQKVGPFTATTESFIIDVSDGVLNINFSSLASDGGVNNPKVSAIEVLDVTGTSSRKSYAATESSIIALSNIAFPNPFMDILKLNVTTKDQSEYQIKVFDMLGRELYLRKFTPGSLATEEHSINFYSENIPYENTYFISIENKNKTYRQIIKVIRNR